ncbi:uncharacterized protein LOC134700582 [Mytilus trossulus]|uniref:uncharacterized protein LOC134700582 n=1 Tax=Mytilus trossulus TaxID=6551 RepID=UPI00300653F2
MTFIKITDPKQREALARDLQETKRSIQASDMQRRLDKIGLSRDLSKILKPVVETQKETASQIVKKIEDIPLALPTPLLALPPPAADDDPLPIEQALTTNLSPRAAHYLQLSMTPKADHTFGLRVEDDAIMIGNLPVTFDGDDIFIDGERYKGTPGLWELMVMKQPEDFEVDDLHTYGDILRASDAMYQGNSAVSQTPKASKSKKWKEIVSYLYKQDKYGSGVQTVFLPKCFDQLLNRLDLCAAAYQAGNNGVRNEIVAILDAMRKSNHISRGEYEKLHRKLL